MLSLLSSTCRSSLLSAFSFQPPGSSSLHPLTTASYQPLTSSSIQPPPFLPQPPCHRLRGHSINRLIYKRSPIIKRDYSDSFSRVWICQLSDCRKRLILDAILSRGFIGRISHLCVIMGVILDREETRIAYPFQFF